jgi:hypothetical protein
MTEIHLTPAQVPAALKRHFAGRTFSAVICETVTIPAGAGLWDGGSRDLFSAIRLADSASIGTPAADPFDFGQRDRSIPIPEGVVIARQSTFQGRDSGVTFYVRAGDVAPFLPQADAPELEHAERVVLACLDGLISRARRDEAARHGVNAGAFDMALVSLNAFGYCKANGAITPQGRNALANLPRIL